jgi:hypothetical protein
MVAAIEEIFETENAPALMDVLKEEGWQEALPEYVAWVWLADLPNKPFTFRGKPVQDVKRFYMRIGEVINEGPRGARAQSGELLAILTDLKKITEAK